MNFISFQASSRSFYCLSSLILLFGYSFGTLSNGFFSLTWYFCKTLFLIKFFPLILKELSLDFQIVERSRFVYFQTDWILACFSSDQILMTKGIEFIDASFQWVQELSTPLSNRSSSNQVTNPLSFSFVSSIFWNLFKGGLMDFGNSKRILLCCLACGVAE